MWQYFVIIMSFLTGFLVIATINLILSDLFQGDQARMKQRLRDEMLSLERERAKESPLLRSNISKDLHDLADEAALDAAVERPSYMDRLKALSEQSGLRWPVSKILSIMGSLFVAAFTLAWLVSNNMFIAVPLGLITSVAPLGYLAYHRSKRLSEKPVYAATR